MGIQGYYSPSMKGNINSYHKLKDTHSVHYDEDTDTFNAVPRSGQPLTFVCIRGHCTMDINNVNTVYMTHSPSKYSVRQLASARKAYEFIKRMEFVSYKGAAEFIQRGSMRFLNFTRSDLVNAQNIYGTPAAYQMGQGTQKTDKCREDEQIPVHESVSQEL